MLKVQLEQLGYIEFVGTSMLPLLKPGDKVCLQRDKFVPLIGDVVLFLDNHILIMHRIVSIDKNRKTVITRGDAKLISDSEIEFSEIVGYLDGLYQSSKKKGYFPLHLSIWNKFMQLVVRLDKKNFKIAFIISYSIKIGLKILRKIHFI